MSVADKGSYFSRFTMKLVEICAASIATAVGGYLVAHLGGYLPWSAREPAPAAIHTTPNVSVVPKGPRAEPAIAAGADEHRPASRQDAGPPPLPPARATAKATPAVAPRKPIATDTGAPGSKPDDMKSVETEVRAALEKVDANRPVAPEAPPSQKTDIAPELPATGELPRPVEAPPVGAVAVAPPDADVAPPPVQPAPLQPEPLPTVEIQSRPVADVATLPPETPAPAQENAKAEDKGLWSTLAKIPAMLRPSASSDPPRPPLPVGQ